MPRSIFGSSYPPGAANDPNAPYNQEDPPCEVCGGFDDKCICPECSVCQEFGNPKCYVEHGLKKTDAQITQREALEEKWAKQQQQEAEMEIEMMKNAKPEEEY